MKKIELRAPDYLGHILQAIERIQRYTEDMDEVAFLNSDLVQDAVIRNIEIIGEAANKLTKCDPEFAEAHHEIPWQVIYAMRNRVSHAYHKVDFEIVWNTIQNDLATMQMLVQDALTNMPGKVNSQKP